MHERERWGANAAGLRPAKCKPRHECKMQMDRSGRRSSGLDLMKVSLGEWTPCRHRDRIYPSME